SNVSGLGRWTARGLRIPARGSTIPGLEVLVGGIAAKVVYTGRSGCCAGIDQIIVEVPRGVEGCNVAARVRYPDGDAGSSPRHVETGVIGRKTLREQLLPGTEHLPPHQLAIVRVSEECFTMRR